MAEIAPGIGAMELRGNGQSGRKDGTERHLCNIRSSVDSVSGISESQNSQGLGIYIYDSGRALVMAEENASRAP